MPDAGVAISRHEELLARLGGAGGWKSGWRESPVVVKTKQNIERRKKFGNGEMKFWVAVRWACLFSAHTCPAFIHKICKEIMERTNSMLEDFDVIIREWERLRTDLPHMLTVSSIHH